MRLLQTRHRLECGNRARLGGGPGDVSVYRRFRQDQMQRYAAMQAAGLGHWFGAFLQGKLVADCGVFAKDGLGRYQFVTTHPAYRRRGLCTRLIYETAQFAFANLVVHQLVIEADPQDMAQRLYEGLGFARVGRSQGLQRHGVRPQDGNALA